MKRFEELYYTEVESYERTLRNLAIAREQLQYIHQFIMENGLAGKFAEWETDGLKK